MTPSEELEVSHADVMAKYFKANGQNLVEVVRHPYFQKMSLEAQKEFLLKHRDELKAIPNIFSYLSKNLMNLLVGLGLTNLTIAGATQNSSNPDARIILGTAAALLGAGVHTTNAVRGYLADRRALNDLRSSDNRSLAESILRTNDVAPLGASGAEEKLDILQKFYVSPVITNHL